MKTLKRIIAVTVLIAIAFAVSYLVYTGIQINNAASKNHAFCEADSICENFRLSGVNARNYILFALKDCGQRGRASENHEISQAQDSREICELDSGVQVSA